MLSLPVQVCAKRGYAFTDYLSKHVWPWDRLIVDNQEHFAFLYHHRQGVQPSQLVEQCTCKHDLPVYFNNHPLWLPCVLDG